jgi:Cu(I)/Ag(I) efflux system protein CusF
MNQEHTSMHMPYVLIAAAGLALAAAPIQAQHNHGADTTASTPAGSSAALSEGEVRRIDKPGGTVTLKHGPLVNVDMPAMTMSFDVKDRAALDRLKVGDKVHFRVEKEGANYVVTRIEK